MLGLCAHTQVMLCFSRDTEINQIINQDVVNNSKMKQYDGPPSVVPFHGICMFGNYIFTDKCFLLLLNSYALNTTRGSFITVSTKKTV